jgi:predicted component of type VI protein secretion system
MVTGRYGLAMVIKVQLMDPQTGSEKTFEFDRSPIRVGRNALNNVVIEDRFVSQWHGMVRFDDTSVSYFDLGSTNGTRFEGKRLAKNTAISLRGPAPLAISRFELRVIASPAAPGAADAAATKTMNSGEAQASGSSLAPPLDIPCQTSEPDRLARCQQILEGFSDAFVALKKGYEEFGAEVGVRPLAGSTPLHRARTGREVMDHLLAPARDADACLRDLQAVFADMGIHQIALMEGITQGIRALLESLDPSVQEAQAGSSALFRSRSKDQWARYQERFATLIAEDTALHAEIFGAEFARAYASVALEPAGPPDRSEG